MNNHPHEFRPFSTNVGKTIINHPFGNGLYHLFMVIWGMVYYCFTHIILVGGIPTPLKNHGVRQLGWWNSHIFWKVIKFHGSKPPTSYRYITDKNHREICILDFFLAPTNRDSDNGIAPPCRCHIRVTGIWVTTVDGRIPAPVNRWLIPWFIGFLSSQVVQVFPSSYHHYIRYIHVYPILTSCLITSFSS